VQTGTRQSRAARRSTRSLLTESWPRPRREARRVGHKRKWLRLGCGGSFGRESRPEQTLIRWWPGAESNHRHADFETVVAGARDFIIKHLQRLPALSPATPRHIHGTPNLSSTHSWHRASRSAANSHLALERYEISGKTERPLVTPFRTVHRSSVGVCIHSRSSHSTQDLKYGCRA
jgi:hypothetical protein